MRDTIRPTDLLTTHAQGQEYMESAHFRQTVDLIAAALPAMLEGLASQSVKDRGAAKVRQALLERMARPLTIAELGSLA